MNLEVIYTAAHAEFPDTEPLGGGKGVADYLMREWRRDSTFSLRVVSPSALGLRLNRPLATMSEREYARFCQNFEKATTAEILKHDPRTCVILGNDISEGPQFKMLGERGYRLVTIFHVDVVEYFAKFYLRSFVSPAWLARWRAFLITPALLRLVFQKQYECVHYSKRIIVPSSPMRDTILQCYTDCPPHHITVLPWGDVSQHPAEAAVPLEINDDEFVILTLSRLSPEKGIERLLLALPHLRLTHQKVAVYICGAAAYMKGREYEQKLRQLAARATAVRIEFTGHVIGTRKASLLQRADVFVSPSRHESYGLTIAEAQAAGCRIISHQHYGATGTIVDCAKPRELGAALETMISQGRTRKSAVITPPSDAARQLARILTEVAVDRLASSDRR